MTVTSSAFAGASAFIFLSAVGIPLLHNMMFKGEIERFPSSGKLFHSFWLTVRVLLLLAVFFAFHRKHIEIRGLADGWLIGAYLTLDWFLASAVYRAMLNWLNGNPIDYIAKVNDGDDSSIDAHAWALWGDDAGAFLYVIELCLAVIAIVALCVL